MHPAVEQGFGEFAAAAFSGPNAYLFIALNLLALGATRSLGVRRGAAFGCAALLSALLGGIQVAEREVVSVSAVMVGVIMGAGFSAFIGYGLVYTVAKLKLPTIPQMLNGIPPPPTTTKEEAPPQAAQPPPPPPPAAPPPPSADKQ